MDRKGYIGDLVSDCRLAGLEAQNTAQGELKPRLPELGEPKHHELVYIIAFLLSEGNIISVPSSHKVPEIP